MTNDKAKELTAAEILALERGERTIKDSLKVGLKPCPFCGSEAELIRDTIPCGDYPDEYDQYVTCSNCGAETRHYDPDTIPNAIEYAVASWSTRPIEAALQARIAELSKPILCAKCNDHLIANDGAICEVCASTQESVIDELQGENAALMLLHTQATDEMLKMQNRVHELEAENAKLEAMLEKAIEKLSIRCPGNVIEGDCHQTDDITCAACWREYLDVDDGK